jgi:hypothetical protein
MGGEWVADRGRYFQYGPKLKIGRWLIIRSGSTGMWESIGESHRMIHHAPFEAAKRDEAATAGLRELGHGR